MTREPEKAASGLGPAGAPAGNVVFLSDGREGADLLGVGDAIRPLAELCLAPGAETPITLGLVGGRGVGKSFALRRLIERVEAIAGAAAQSGSAAFLSKVVVARVDAAPAGGDPASAIAAAVFAALEREQNGTAYTQLVDEAAHGATDPRRAASVAAERHDEAIRRLEQEREARDEVEAKRARIAEALLYDTPGSRIDAFTRAARGRIERRLRKFGFLEGDAGANFRSLVRDLAGVGASARYGVLLRAIWAYRGQLRLILLAVIAFAVAFALHWLRSLGGEETLSDMSAQFAPAVDWLKAHDEPIEYVTEALIVLGFAALFANLWRAATFSSLLFRGLRLLHLDVRERRRELDASAARLERRVAALQVEADAANQRAETLARRAGGGGAPVMRPPGPPFLQSSEGPAKTAREFMGALSRAMSGGAVPAPQRLLIAIDHVERMPAADALRFAEVATSLAGPGVAVIVACDPQRMGGDPRDIAEGLFQVVFDVGTVGEAEGETLAGRLLAPQRAAAPLGEVGAERSALAEPLGGEETRLLTSASAVIGANPRALKRFFNAYRLARLEAPRPVVAVSLAALLAPDPSAAHALRWSLFSEGETLAPPSDPPALRVVFESAGLGSFDKSAAQSGWSVARRYAPWLV